MKPQGWFFLLLSWTFIVGLCAFCFRHMFEQRRRRRTHHS